jgi:putative ABC transport system permease protein
MILADLRGLRWVAWAVVALVAVSVAVGVLFEVAERSLRVSSARVANDFPLVIGAPGSQIQLVLSALYLDLNAIPLVEGEVLQALSTDARVKHFAPIAFGDAVRGFPVIGTTADMALRWGKAKVTTGRIFEAEAEAVVGSDVNLEVGESFAPSHGLPLLQGAPSRESPEEASHGHEGVNLKVVGRIERLGSPWDRAVLVPIESVWDVHGLGNGHGKHDGPVGPPFDAEAVPGVPAIVVEPTSFANAYALRGQYRKGGTMAVFPAEVLVSLYQSLGDIKDALVLAAKLNSMLMISALLLLVLAIAGLRRRRYAVLRALGASPAYVFAVTWVGTSILVTIGAISGLVLGWLVAEALTFSLQPLNGLRLVFEPKVSDVSFAAFVAGVGVLLAMIPGFVAIATSIADGLRS